MPSAPYWVAGRAARGEHEVPVTGPHGVTAGTTTTATAAHVEHAVAAADGVREEFAASPAALRAGALEHVSWRLE